MLLTCGGSQFFSHVPIVPFWQLTLIFVCNHLGFIRCFLTSRGVLAGLVCVKNFNMVLVAIFGIYQACITQGGSFLGFIWAPAIKFLIFTFKVALPLFDLFVPIWQKAAKCYSGSFPSAFPLYLCLDGNKGTLSLLSPSYLVFYSVPGGIL